MNHMLEATWFFIAAFSLLAGILFISLPNAEYVEKIVPCYDKYGNLIQGSVCTDKQPANISAMIANPISILLPLLVIFGTLILLIGFFGGKPDA